MSTVDEGLIVYFEKRKYFIGRYFWTHNSLFLTRKKKERTELRTAPIGIKLLYRHYYLRH